MVSKTEASTRKRMNVNHLDLPHYQKSVYCQLHSKSNNEQNASVLKYIVNSSNDRDTVKNSRHTMA